MVDNHSGNDLLDTTDCLEAVGVFKGWKNFLFLIVLLCLLLLQVSFFLVDRGFIKVGDQAYGGEPVVEAPAPEPEGVPSEPVEEGNVPPEPVIEEVPLAEEEPVAETVVEPDETAEVPETVEAVEVDEPGEANEPAEPEGLAEAAEPNEPAEAVEPNEPAETDETLESSEPNEPAEAGEVAEPNDTSEGSEPVDPNGSADPNELADLSHVHRPIEPITGVKVVRMQYAGQWMPEKMFSKMKFEQLAWLIRLVNAVLILTSTLYCLTLLFSLKVSMNGRLGGINHISRAFFLSLLMLVLLLPWQKMFGGIVTGAMYTPEELVKWYSAKTDEMLDLVLYYLRFSGYGVLMLLLLILSQLRSLRWAKAILRRLEII